MKKSLKIFFSLVLITTFAFSLSACKPNTVSKNETTNSTVTVRLNEVTRSLFYSPMYIAMSEGFFAEEGIEIDLATGHPNETQMQ